jgi:hypothetical protein
VGYAFPQMPAHRSWLLLVAVVTMTTLATGLSGCKSAGGVTGTHVPSSPFMEADKLLFSDGIDMIGEPDGLSGRWAEDWSTELRDRVKRSDLIAVLTVNTLRTEVSPSQRSTHWLVAEVGDVLKGNYDGELGLAAMEGSLGFESVERERSNVLHKPMVVFAKWVADDAGVVRAHWHLAPATKNIVGAVRLSLAGAQPSQTAIIEHTD